MPVSFVFKCFNSNIFPTKNKNSCVFCYKYANQMIDGFKKKFLLILTGNLFLNFILHLESLFFMVIRSIFVYS